MFRYVKFFCDGLVVMLESCMLISLPKCTVYGAILVVVFGISFISCIISATLSASFICDHLVSLFSTDMRLFIVWIRCSIIPVALWSPTGAKISLMLFSWQNISNCLDLNACAWSHLKFLGIPWNFMYWLRYSIAVSALQLWYIFV